VIRALTIGIRVEPELKAALERAAKDDRRTVSSLVEGLLEDWLREKGYLPKEKEAKR
jgi:hypothetical protein